MKTRFLLLVALATTGCVPTFVNVYGDQPMPLESIGVVRGVSVTMPVAMFSRVAEYRGPGETVETNVARNGYTPSVRMTPGRPVTASASL